MSSLALPPVPLGTLGERITELSAQVNAATARLYAMLEEFDRRDGWGEWGVVSMEHWLQVRCGETPSGARDKARAARALSSLPQTAAAFARGELAESAVRTITRAGTPDNEDVLLQFARYGTGSHLAKVCRLYRRVVATICPEQRAVINRYVRFRYDDDGTLYISARFPPDEGAYIRQVFEAVAEQLRNEGVAVEEPIPAGVPAAEDEPYDADGVPAAEDEPYDADGAPGTPWQRERAGSAPILDSSPGHEQRNADALLAMAEAAVAGSARPPLPPERCTVVVHVDVDTLAGRNGRCELADGTPIPPDIGRMLACDASMYAVVEDADGTPLDVGRKHRIVPLRIRRALQARDPVCRFPQCGRMRWLQAHHVKWWTDGGRTSIENAVHLCSEHHRALHRGAFWIEQSAPGVFVFRSRCGWIIGRAGPADGTGDLEAANAAVGIRVDADTCRPQWGGETCDYSVAIEHLLRRADLYDTS
jgi:hypothetical protein